MNKIFKYSIGVLFAGLTMTACSPDEFSGADPNGLPTVSGVDFQMTIDQETNQMVANYSPAAGTYPIWILNGTQYSTLQEVGYNNPEAGTYTIELKLGNRNGFSQAGLQKTFTFNETKIDYSADFRRITGKEWRFANKEVAHLGCGPAGTAGTEWWSAQPDDKAGTGMYDDRITFTADTRKGGTFNYSAGADGLTYVNTGTTKWGSEAADWDATIGNQTSTWSFEVYDWEDADGNIHALRVGTAFERFSTTQKEWVNNHTVNIKYGDITKDKDYESYMGLGKQMRAMNSKGKIVPIIEEGWASPDEKPTHMILSFSCGIFEAFKGHEGNTFWVDNVKLVFP